MYDWSSLDGNPYFPGTLAAYTLIFHDMFHYNLKLKVIPEWDDKQVQLKYTHQVANQSNPMY